MLVNSVIYRWVGRSGTRPRAAQAWLAERTDASLRQLLYGRQSFRSASLCSLHCGVAAFLGRAGPFNAFLQWVLGGTGPYNRCLFARRDDLCGRHALVAVRFLLLAPCCAISMPPSRKRPACAAPACPPQSGASLWNGAAGAAGAWIVGLYKSIGGVRGARSGWSTRLNPGDDQHDLSAIGVGTAA